MIKENIYAVITGDLINSTTIAIDYHAVLSQITESIKEYRSPDMVFDTYRGDGFQALVKNPKDALLISIIFRAGLRRHSKSPSIDDAWDARISIGIGKIENEKPNSELGRMSGEAFVRSGRTLDGMKKEGARLKITTGDEQLDKEFESTCPLADTIINRWTTYQADAIYLLLLKQSTQTEIGNELNTTQKAISKRLISSNLESMNNFFKRYEEVIEWKYSK